MREKRNGQRIGRKIECVRVSATHNNFGQQLAVCALSVSLLKSWFAEGTLILRHRV